MKKWGNEWIVECTVGGWYKKSCWAGGHCEAEK